jgi:hypothetical protein
LGEPGINTVRRHAWPMFRVTSDAPIEAALKPVKLCERIHKTCRELGSRFVIQSVGLD